MGPVSLEFCLPGASVPRLLRTAPFTRPGRPAQADRVWHDTADGALAQAGLSLCERAGHWRLERAAPGAMELWPPGTPAPLVAEASEMAGLANWIPGPLAPIAGFKGRQWKVTAGELSLTVADGELHGVVQSAPSCRAVLDGPALAVADVVDLLAGSVPLAVPLWSWAAEAVGVARGALPAPRRTGGPAIPPGLSVADAAALVIGHLTDVLLAVAGEAAAGRTPGGVHQMRVAARRLRSGLSVFRHAVDSPELEALRPGLTLLAAVLGGARDWDVFLGGAGPAVAQALGEDRRLVAMLAAAQRRRTGAYAELRAWLAGPAFQGLVLALVKAAALRNWEATDDEAAATVLAGPAVGYAAAELGRRTSQMLKAGNDIETLPVEALHDLRKQGKRLRYAAEFFMPLFGRRASRDFVERLADLQEQLGHLNDAATAARLMEALGHGAGQQFAAGAVQGYTAALAGDVRAGIHQAWRKFRKTGPFW